MTTWAADEVAAFLARSNAGADRYVPLWTLIATTGLRRGEALGLRWSDVDFDRARASIVQTVIDEGSRTTGFGTPKTSSGVRTVDLDPTTVRSLRDQRRRQAGQRLLIGVGWRDYDLVFAKIDGRPLDPERVSREFQRRIERWGLRRIRLHDLRHTWATLALRAGVPVKVVQERLGHSSPVITASIYMHVTPGMQADAAAKVAS